jgi:hypothetical protein
MLQNSLKDMYKEDTHMHSKKRKHRTEILYNSPLECDGFAQGIAGQQTAGRVLAQQYCGSISFVSAHARVTWMELSDVNILRVVEQIQHTAYLDSGCGDLEIGRLSCATEQLRFRAVGGKSHVKKKSAYEDLTCDVKTLSELQCSDVVQCVCSWKSELGLAQCGSEQLVKGED